MDAKSSDQGLIFALGLGLMSSQWNLLLPLRSNSFAKIRLLFIVEERQVTGNEKRFYFIFLRVFSTSFSSKGGFPKRKVYTITPTAQLSTR